MKKKVILSGYNNIKQKSRQVVESRPIASFLAALTLVVGIIATGSYLRQPQVEDGIAKPAKKVKTYQIGSAPTVRFQGQVEKSGTTTVVALAGGIVQKVNVGVGQKVGRGQTLVSLSQNYQGGNAASVARQIAARQYDLATSTYDSQIDGINKQRQVAEATADNAGKMREMSRQAASDTRSVIDLNNSIISSLENTLNLVSADPASNAATILSTKQYLVQFKGTNAQLSASLRAAEYQGSDDTPPTTLSNLQKDLVLKQLDIQEKSLAMSRDIAGLSLKVAQINESMFYPASPYTGVVQRIFVRPGQIVAPGTPLAVVAASGTQNSDVVVLVPQSVATEISRLQESTIILNDTRIHATPAFVSTEAVTGSQYAVTYHLTGDDIASLTDKSYVTVEIPLGNPDTVLTKTPTVPVDSVYQTESSSTIFVVRDGKAVSTLVELGGVMGDYVVVSKGLGDGDHVILDRSVIDGDLVEE